MTQGGNYAQHGDRTPFIGIAKTTSRFHIASAVNGAPNFHASQVENSVSINQKYHFAVHQRYVSDGNYRYFITIDGEEIYTVLNTNATQFYNVKVFMSNNWQAACPVYISNFEITNFL